jgi:hypothetical protein
LSGVYMNATRWMFAPDFFIGSLAHDAKLPEMFSLASEKSKSR